MGGDDLANLGGLVVEGVGSGSVKVQGNEPVAGVPVEQPLVGHPDVMSTSIACCASSGRRWPSRRSLAIACPSPVAAHGPHDQLLRLGKGTRDGIKREEEGGLPRL